MQNYKKYSNDEILHPNYPPLAFHHSNIKSDKKGVKELFQLLN